MVAIYLLLIMFGRLLQAIFNKHASNKLTDLCSLIGFSTFQFFCSCIPCLLIILLSGNDFKIDLLTVLLSLFLGLSMFLSGACNIFAMKSGTVALGSMFGTAGMLIPLIAGIFLFNSPISIFQWLGVVIFFVAAYFLIGSSKKIYTNFSFKTVLFLIGSLVFNGCSALAQQMFTHYVPNGNVSVFTFLSFCVIAVLGLLVFACIKKTNSTEKQPSDIKTLAISAVALAIAVFIINQVITISTTLIAPVMLFTFANGGGTIISTIVGATMYKEKLTVQSIVGIILGIASLIIIKIF